MAHAFLCLGKLNTVHFIFTIMLHFIFSEFPFKVRSASSLFFMAAVIFFTTLLFSFFYVQQNTEAVYLVYGENQVINFTYMYDPEHIKLSSNSSQNTTKQFLFYIFNNCWIAIKIFLGGLLIGLGSIILLIYNAISMGLLMGFLVAHGYGSTLWPTIIGHSSFELIATIISAAAGFKVGWSMIGPITLRVPRLQHIILEFKQSVLLMYGALVLFTLAGLIEAFWSSNNTIPDIAKYIVGCMFWVILPLYLWLAGRFRTVKL